VGYRENGNNIAAETPGPATRKPDGAVVPMLLVDAPITGRKKSATLLTVAVTRANEKWPERLRRRSCQLSGHRPILDAVH